MVPTAAAAEMRQQVDRNRGLQTLCYLQILFQTFCTECRHECNDQLGFRAHGQTQSRSSHLM